MPINLVNLKKAVQMVGADHAKVIARLAHKQDQIENKWIYEVGKAHDEIVDQILQSLKKDGKVSIPNKVFADFLFKHYLSVADSAIESTDQELRVIAPVHMAKKAKPLPRSFSEIRRLYDHFRKTGQVPKLFKEQSVKIKDQYLKKTQSVWKKYSEEFREGDEFTQENVLRKVKESADTVESRAKTIVRTETTNYYNDVRREIYDQSDAIWGYLFLAIRDQGTTKWCNDKVTDGKRGRHGLVFKKGGKFTDKETPSCHWNCRSEFTPLTIYNPRHRLLIENTKLWRENNTCHPLPREWN